MRTPQNLNRMALCPFETSGINTCLLNLTNHKNQIPNLKKMKTSNLGKMLKYCNMETWCLMSVEVNVIELNSRCWSLGRVAAVYPENVPFQNGGCLEEVVVSKIRNFSVSFLFKLILYKIKYTSFLAQTTQAVGNSSTFMEAEFVLSCL